MFKYWPSDIINADDLIGEKEKSRLLTEEMEATLQDIQNMYLSQQSIYETRNFYRMNGDRE
jgi:predicted RNA-binding protein with EMAP domain